MKKTYITPAFLAVELGMKSVTMLSASDQNSGQNILRNDGTGDGTDIGAKEYTSKSLWDNEW